MIDRLSKYEQETIINFNRGDHIVSIFTYDRVWQRHLENKLGLKPVIENYHGGKEYEVDKSCIRMPQKKRSCSEVYRKRLVERFSKRHSEVKNGSS